MADLDEMSKRMTESMTKQGFKGATVTEVKPLKRRRDEPKEDDISLGSEDTDDNVNTDNERHRRPGRLSKTTSKDLKKHKEKKLKRKSAAVEIDFTKTGKKTGANIASPISDTKLKATDVSKKSATMNEQHESQQMQP